MYQYNDYTFRLNNEKYIYFFNKNNLKKKIIGRVKTTGGDLEINIGKKWVKQKYEKYMPNIDQKIRNVIKTLITIY